MGFYVFTILSIKANGANVKLDVIILVTTDFDPNMRSYIICDWPSSTNPRAFHWMCKLDHAINSPVVTPFKHDICSLGRKLLFRRMRILQQSNMELSIDCRNSAQFPTHLVSVKGFLMRLLENIHSLFVPLQSGSGIILCWLFFAGSKKKQNINEPNMGSKQFLSCRLRVDCIGSGDFL